jgi:hypothetical protein
MPITDHLEENAQLGYRKVFSRSDFFFLVIEIEKYFAFQIVKTKNLKLDY